MITGVQARKWKTTKTYDWLRPSADGDSSDTVVLVVDPKTEVETTFSMSASTAHSLSVSG